MSLGNARGTRGIDAGGNAGRRRIAAAVIAALIALATAAPAARSDEPAAGKRGFDHSALDALVRKYAAPDGVAYRAWAGNDADRRALDEYVTRLAAGRPSALPGSDALAFWINAYNAVTLKLILDHYPVDGIKDIGSPWKKKLLTVEGRELSLDEIENDVIRKQWKEPRIHFALNCASVSCPPLRPEAYTGAGLDAALERQTREFLAGPENRLDPAARKLHLSKIFQWYREDFEREGSLVDWLRPYLPELGPAGSEDPKIDFAGYDWNLNESEGEAMSTDQEQHDRRIDYIEFPAPDLDAMKKFYGDAFGWRFQDWGPDYVSFEDGRLSGGFRRDESVAAGGPLVVLYAVDLEGSEAAVKTAGGSVVKEIFSFPGGRRFHFRDPAGHELAIWSDR